VSDLSAIASVDSRIAAIRARIGALTSTPTRDGASLLAEIGGPPDPKRGFDPFGAVYQVALESVGAGAPSSSVTAGASMRMEAYGGSSIGTIGGYGTMPVPVELQMYGNGKIPAAALEPIGQGGHRLFAPAAAQWQSLVAAAAADGVTMKVTDSYRSYEQQVDLAGRKGLYEDGGLAAIPGSSNHGWGLAVDADVGRPEALAWMKANGHAYGFVEAVPREPWHWEYRPNQA
jgi:zinc D-Ala-D-Ala carboxypeptidase